MKKIQILTLTIGLCALMGCTEAPSSVEPTTYFAQGRYYLQGEVITEDGNIWEYSQDIISDEPSYHNEPVIVCIYDNGTPNNIYDDEVLGLVLNQGVAE